MAEFFRWVERVFTESKFQTVMAGSVVEPLFLRGLRFFNLSGWPKIIRSL
jgi:hypothetical protein